MDTQLISILGLTLLVIGWIPQTISNFKNKGKHLDLKFVILYFFGSVFLTWHALNISDMVFSFLNAFAGAIAAFNIWIILSNRNKKTRTFQKKRKGK